MDDKLEHTKVAELERQVEERRMVIRKYKQRVDDLEAGLREAIALIHDDWAATKARLRALLPEGGEGK